MDRSLNEKPEALLQAERDLIELYHQLLAEGGAWDQPFLAGVGRRYGSRWPRLLVVGKATAGWCHVELPVTPKTASQQSARFLAAPTHGAFFRYVRDLALLLTDAGNAGAGERYLHAEEIEGGWSDHIAWTNLGRIGFAAGNPAGKAFDRQEEICRRLLIAEIEWLRPDLIVLLSGDYRCDLVEEVLAHVSWDLLPDAGHNSAWCGLWNGITVVWTMHPERKSLEGLGREREAISARLVARVLQGQG